MLYAACFIFFVISLLLSVKIILMKKSLAEISAGFSRSMSQDTNVVVSVSSRDKSVLDLACNINDSLLKLKKSQLRFKHGDEELKAVIFGISHDLRTPLTAILGYLDMLEKSHSTNSCFSRPEYKYLQGIRNRAELLKQLTEELFDYSLSVSAEERIKSEPVLINSALEESLAGFYTALTDRGITPDVQITDTKITRNLDRDCLMRIFSNLLNNAVKYSNGDLNVTLDQSGMITFSNSSDVLTEVQVQKLFDRFYTVESARRSTGLGLAIAKALTEKMSGKISAAYKDGRFSVNLIFPEK